MQDRPEREGVDLRGNGGALLVAGDELDVLNTGAVGDGDGRDDGPVLEVPEPESRSLLDAESGLENAERHNKVRSQDDLLLKVDAEAVGVELLAENVEGALNIFGPLVDDVTSGVRLDEAAGRGADGATHVSDEEATLGLGADLVDNRAQQSAVAVRELGVVGIRHIKVESSVLRLEETEETATDEGLAVGRGTQVVRGVATARNISEGDDLTKGILEKSCQQGDSIIRRLLWRWKRNSHHQDSW